MGQYFTENDEDESLVKLFGQKKVYQIANRSKYINLIDFSFAEKNLYGRVDRYFEPIVPNEEHLMMKDLSRGIKTYNFVADAFAQLQGKFTVKLARREISDTEEFLTNLKATGGYKSPHRQYQKYMSSYSNALGRVIKNRDLKFVNFEQFIKVTMPYIENGLKGKVFTFPAFVKSTSCSIMSTGLAIEIASIDPNNDQVKYDKFYKSKNWDFFVNACNTYGFMVDANMPNRIIADVASPNMVAKMKAHNPLINSTDMFLANCYDNAALGYFETFKKFLYTLYYDNRKKKILTTTHNHNDSTKTIINKVIAYTYEDFVSQFSDLYFLNLYCKIRFLEEESKFQEYEKRTLTENTIELAATDFNLALGSFEKILNKPFDYVGSLSYIKMREKKLGQ